MGESSEGIVTSANDNYDWGNGGLPVATPSEAVRKLAVEDEEEAQLAAIVDKSKHADGSFNTAHIPTPSGASFKSYCWKATTLLVNLVLVLLVGFVFAKLGWLNGDDLFTQLLYMASAGGINIITQLIVNSKTGGSLTESGRNIKMLTKKWRGRLTLEEVASFNLRNSLVILGADITGIYAAINSLVPQLTYNFDADVSFIMLVLTCGASTAFVLATRPMAVKKIARMLFRISDKDTERESWSKEIAKLRQHPTRIALVLVDLLVGIIPAVAYSPFLYAVSSEGFRKVFEWIFDFTAPHAYSWAWEFSRENPSVLTDPQWFHHASVVFSDTVGAGGATFWNAIFWFVTYFGARRDVIDAIKHLRHGGEAGNDDRKLVRWVYRLAYTVGCGTGIALSVFSGASSEAVAKIHMKGFAQIVGVQANEIYRLVCVRYNVGLINAILSLGAMKDVIGPKILLPVIRRLLCCVVESANAGEFADGLDLENRSCLAAVVSCCPGATLFGLRQGESPMITKLYQEDAEAAAQERAAITRTADDSGFGTFTQLPSMSRWD